MLLSDALVASVSRVGVPVYFLATPIRATAVVAQAEPAGTATMAPLTFDISSDGGFDADLDDSLTREPSSSDESKVLGDDDECKKGEQRREESEQFQGEYEDVQSKKELNVKARTEFFDLYGDDGAASDISSLVGDWHPLPGQEGKEVPALSSSTVGSGEVDESTKGDVAEAKDKEDKAKEARERASMDREAKEKAAKEQETKEKEAKEQEAKEKENKVKEKETKEMEEKDATEKDAKDKEAKEFRVGDEVEAKKVHFSTDATEEDEDVPSPGCKLLNAYDHGAVSITCRTALGGQWAPLPEPK